MARLVDLSHTVEDGLVTYRGLPAPVICDYWSREESSVHFDEGVSFQIGKIEMVANTGTYLDAPFHRYAGGKDLAELDIESVADIEGVLVRTEGTGRALGPDLFSEIECAGKAILVQTGWDRHWNTEAYFEGHPFLTREAAAFLRDAGVRLVGIDSYNIDDTADTGRPAHSILLGADIPIVEHMTNLASLPDSGFRCTAAPVKVRGMGTFPVRAFAVLP